MKYIALPFGDKLNIIFNAFALKAHRIKHGAVYFITKIKLNVLIQIINQNVHLNASTIANTHHMYRMCPVQPE